MSDGKTHDWITYVTVIPATFLMFILVGKPLAISFAVGYLFSGIMFNGDLDTESTPYYRWGPLRWMWLPYRKFGHRSTWTHGFLRGTATRLLWISPLILLLIGACMYGYGIMPVSQFLFIFWKYIFIFVVGLESGSMSHTLADISSSAWKRVIYRIFGIRLVPGFVKNKYRK